MARLLIVVRRAIDFPVIKGLSEIIRGLLKKPSDKCTFRVEIDYAKFVNDNVEKWINDTEPGQAADVVS